MIRIRGALIVPARLNGELIINMSLISGRPQDGDGGGDRGPQLCGDGARGGGGRHGRRLLSIRSAVGSASLRAS